MFTMDCIRINGTALGVCGDRFYFGSCCVVPALDEELNALERMSQPAFKRQRTPSTYLLETKEDYGRSYYSSDEELEREVEDESEYNHFY